MILVRKALSHTVWLLLVGVFALSVSLGQAQQAATTRKILDRRAPAYPALARSMGLQGIVKVDVTVAPDGSVKDISIKGGHPVLAQAAANAVRQWR